MFPFESSGTEILSATKLVSTDDSMCRNHLQCSVSVAPPRVCKFNRRLGNDGERAASDKTMHSELN